MNPPFSNCQAALAIIKALVLYFSGANVCLLIPTSSTKSKNWGRTLEKHGKFEYLKPV
jgi:hypothetical protein